jgi:hypothetical protein
MNKVISPSDFSISHVRDSRFVMGANKFLLDRIKLRAPAPRI